jgi:glucose-1-phosphate cytidylyltransferase
MTYGDGLSDINIAEEIAFHKGHGRQATVACVRPPARFGRIVLEGHKVLSFEEKPHTEGGMINGGFFVLQPGVLKLIEGDDTVWENEPLAGLAAKGELSAFLHEQFWQPMDTLRDKQRLAALWDSGEAPWRVWRA